MVIESLSNKIVKNAAALKNKKDRDKTSLFVAEGERLVAELGGFKVRYYILSESYAEKTDLSALTKAQCHIVTDAIFSKISDTVNPQGILAVCEQKKYSCESLLSVREPFFVLAENLNDPGNMGTIIRTADAMGASGVFLSKGCVDVYNPKVIRSAMGSVFHIPIAAQCDLNEIMMLLSAKGIPTTGAHLKGEKFPEDVDFTKNAAIIIGNEANGLSDDISGKADNLVKIPMLGRAESLNAAAACIILLYEVTRQRLQNKS